MISNQFHLIFRATPMEATRTKILMGPNTSTLEKVKDVQIISLFLQILKSKGGSLYGSIERE